jgi:hypothetical protein
MRIVRRCYAASFVLVFGSLFFAGFSAFLVELSFESLVLLSVFGFSASAAFLYESLR